MLLISKTLSRVYTHPKASIRKKRAKAYETKMRAKGYRAEAVSVGGIWYAVDVLRKK